jgi:hypothetical protein
MVNWLLKTRGETFTDREMAAIQRDHFDPVKALEAAIAEAKKQQVNGEEIDLHALLDAKLLPSKRKASRPRRRKSKDFEDVKASF